MNQYHVLVRAEHIVPLMAIDIIQARAQAEQLCKANNQVSELLNPFFGPESRADVWGVVDVTELPKRASVRAREMFNVTDEAWAVLSSPARAALVTAMFQAERQDREAMAAGQMSLQTGQQVVTDPTANR